MIPFRFILFALILYFGISALKIEFSVLQIGLFDVFNDIPFVTLSLVTVAVVFTDAKFFAKTRKWYEFTSSVLGLVFIGIVLKGKVERYAINTSPGILFLQHIPGNYPVFSLELKKNGCFKLHDANMFGETIYYGDYKRSGDSIYLVRYKSEDKDQLPRTGFIRGDTVSWNDSIIMTIAEEKKQY
jgi:hypothetical protein